MKKILVIAAHPDDDILGCGATLAKKIQQGVKCRVIFIAEGTTARYDLKNLSSDQEKSMHLEIQRRTNYAKEALKILSCLDFEFYNLPCARLDGVPIVDIGKILEKEISNFKPDTIFTHSYKDVNIDHKMVYQAVLQATRPGALNLVNKIFSFEVLSSSEWKFDNIFNPNYFISLEKEFIDLKIKALLAYKSETKSFPFPRSEEGVLTLSKYRGMQCASDYAEAFELVREIQ